MMGAVRLAIYFPKSSLSWPSTNKIIRSWQQKSIQMKSSRRSWAILRLQNQHSIEEERKKQKYAAFSSCLSSEDVIDDRLTSLTESDKMDENNSEESKVRYLIDIWREA